jgi:hypothetical protein
LDPPGDRIYGQRRDAVLEREDQPMQARRDNCVHPRDQRFHLSRRAQLGPVDIEPGIGPNPRRRDGRQQRLHRAARRPLPIAVWELRRVRLHQHHPDHGQTRLRRRQRQVRVGAPRAIALGQESNGSHSDTGAIIV